jgi:hypothetical protein
MLLCLFRTQEILAKIVLPRSDSDHAGLAYAVFELHRVRVTTHFDLAGK